jgi:hypothetical protein
MNGPKKLECYKTQEILAGEKHSSILGPFETYEENKGIQQNDIQHNDTQHNDI